MQTVKFKLPNEIVEEMERLDFCIGLKDHKALVILALREKLHKLRCVSDNLILLDKGRDNNSDWETYE